MVAPVPKAVAFLVVLSSAPLLCAALVPSAPRLGRARSSALRSIRVSVLDPDDAAAQGVREWPFSSRPKGISEEVVAQGTVRYVLKGTGEVEWSDFAGGVASEEAVAVGPGSLVEAGAERRELFFGPNRAWNSPKVDPVVLGRSRPTSSATCDGGATRASRS